MSPGEFELLKRLTVALERIAEAITPDYGAGQSVAPVGESLEKLVELADRAVNR